MAAKTRRRLAGEQTQYFEGANTIISSIPPGCNIRTLLTDRWTSEIFTGEGGRYRGR